MLGPYRLESVLGSGAMGTVWLAHGPAGPVAIKALGPAAADHPLLVRALRAEIRLAVDLDHANVARLVETGSVTAEEAAEAPGQLLAGAPWVALELADGTLADHAPDTMPGARAVLDAVLAALAHAHARGVVHRDVKPANVLRHAERQWLLGDFGMALARGDEDDALQGGTSGYAAPEQRRGELRRQGPWTDLYAVGALACWLFTGDPDGWPAELPESWLGWLGWLREADPRQRCRHATEARWVLRTLPDPDVSLPLDRRDVPRSDATSVGWLDDPSAAALEVPAAPRPAMRWQDWRTETAPLQVGPGLVRARTPPMIGRVAHQDELWGALQRASAGERVVVLVRGDGGSGASRLARWAVEQADELGIGAGFVARHSPLGGDRFGLRGLVARALRLTDRADPEAVRAALDEVHLPDPEAVVELLCPELPRARLARPARALEVVSEVVAAVSGSRVPVVWLDDLQWAPETLRWLAADRSPGLVIGTVADELLAERPVEAGRLDALDARTIRLTRLEPEVAAQLALATVDLDPVVATRLADHTAGAPLFLTQLVRSWAEEGMARGPGGLVPEGPWPVDLDAVWARRLARVLADAAGGAVALQLACCLGEHIDDDEWEGACLAAGVERPASLVPALLASGLLLPLDVSPARWQLTNRRLATTVLRHVPPAELRARYRACAEVVRPVEHLRIADLCARAGDLAAATLHRIGATKAVMTHDIPAAVAMAETWLQSAAPGGERAHATVALAEALVMAGEWNRAAPLAERARAEAEAAGDPSAQARALHLLGRHSAAVHLSLAEAAACFRRALELGAQRPGEGFLPHEVWNDLATTLHDLNRDEESQQAIREAAAYGAAPGQRSHSWVLGASLLAHRGRADGARALLALAEPHLPLFGVSIRSSYEQVLAMIALVERDLVTAREQFERSLALRRWAGLTSPGASARLAEIDLAEGRPSDAEARLRDWPRNGSWMQAMWAGCAALRGDLEAFVPLLEVLEREPTKLLEPEGVAVALERLGRTDLAGRWRAVVAEGLD